MISTMRKNVLFFLVSFIVLGLILLFFTVDYLNLTRYTREMNIGNRVYASFQNLSRQVKNAAVLYPGLVKTSSAAKVENLFFTDRQSILWQLDILKTTIEDSTTRMIEAELNGKIKSELSWIIESNVPDSIVNNKSPGHIASLISIDSLINRGIERTGFLLADCKRKQDGTMQNLRVWMILFIILSGILLIYTSISLFRQQDKRKEKEKELGIVLNRISDGVVSVDNNWRYTFLNDAALATHPRSRKETLGEVIWDVHPEMKGTVFWDKYHQAMDTRKTVEIDSYYAAMNTWFSVKVYPSPDGLTIFYNDVTESKKAEQDIRQLNAELDQKVLERTNELLEAKNELSQTLERVSFLATIADSIQDPVIATDNNSVITKWNKGAEKLLEWKSEEVIGKKATEILKGLYPQVDREHILQFLKKDHFWQGEIIYHTKPGRPVNVLATASDLKDAKGNMIGYLVLVRDITDRKKAEDALNKLNEELEQRVKDRTEEIVKREKLFRALVENNYDVISLMDESFKIIYRSPSATRISGWTDAELQVAGTSNIHPNDMEKAGNIAKELMANPGKPINWSFRSLHKDGHYFWVEGMIINLLHDEYVKAIVFNFRDVTERIEAEEKLALSELRFRALIENSADGIVMTDELSNVLYRSPGSQKITGETTIENTITRPLHPDDVEIIKNKRAETLQRPAFPVPFQCRVLHASGHYCWIEGTFTSLLHVNGVNAIVANYRDITQRKESEEIIIKSEKIYKTIASSIPGSVICLLDTDYRYLLIEGDMVEKLGYSKFALLGNKMEEVLATDIFEGVQKELQRVLAGETVTRESSSFGYELLSKFIPLKDENNTVYAIMTVAIDVTKLKTAQRDIAELNRGLEQKIMQRTKQLESVNKELESFSYSVSHDLRAPLRIIDGFGQILIEDYAAGLDDEGQRVIKVMMSSARKMGLLIDDLLSFSKIGRSDMRIADVNMNKLIEEVLEDLKNSGVSIPADLRVDKIKPASGDSNLLKQVWTNLISNAIKYSAAKKDPAIQIGMMEKKNEMVYYIKDNGAGFDMQYADKLFGVFQRLHKPEEFEGTGVGLALVQRIIVRHGGTIWADAKENEGAAFYFTLS